MILKVSEMTDIDCLIEKGLSLDQAINQMRANSEDAELLRAMGMSVA